MSNYLLRKPSPPAGYRLLIEGQDKTAAQDLIWVMEKDGGQRWRMAIKQTDAGLALASDTAQLYKEPKQIEDYCFFRCRKLGHERK